jgi:hypothetical protein
MEKNFYTDDFEHFLKDTTDNFRMYPSRKVWHSIYNDMHPARKWPSLAVCLLLVTAILFVGISNNNEINQATRRNMAEQALLAARQSANSPVNNNNSLARNNAANIAATGIPAISTQRIYSAEKIISPTATSITGTADIGLTRIFSPETDVIEQLSKNNHITKNSRTLLAGYSHTIQVSVAEISSDPANIGTEHPAGIAKNTQQTSTPADQKVIAKNILAPFSNMEEKSWIENYAFHNQAGIKRLKDRSSFQFYITPSVGFRVLNRTNDAHPLILSNAPAPVMYSNINETVNQLPALNLEAGAALIYKLSKKFRFKTGIQFNYTNYISKATDIGHPVQTNLQYNNGNAMLVEQRSTNYLNSVNGTSNRNLKNTTMQLSVPIGADFKIAGNERLKWYAGATVQPSFVTAGHVYAISGDGKNYIEEPSLVRQWNINTGVETFLSYKTASGVILNVGPQVRYQLFSTYNKQYTYTEKLYNIGLKLGITTNF